MTRVATNASFQSALMDLQRAQVRGQDAQNRFSTGKIASDLTGFGRGAETLTALKSTDVRLDGFIAAGETARGRLEVQNLALLQLGDAAGAARQAVADAISAGRMDALIAQLEAAFSEGRGALNVEHQGAYLFAGGQVETAPLSAESLADLAAAPSVADVFENDRLKTSARLDESTSVPTGQLADDLAGPLMTALRDLYAYHTGPGGPLSGQMDAADHTFLNTKLGELKTAQEGVIQATALNGLSQSRVDAVMTRQESQKIQLTELIGARTDADAAQAITDLQLSQIAIQGAAQVISALRDTSLLNLLTP